MLKNIGSADGIIRITAATMIVILTIAGILKGAYGLYACILAAILAVSSFFRICPLYYPLGITTYHSKN